MNQNNAPQSQLCGTRNYPFGVAVMIGHKLGQQDNVLLIVGPYTHKHTHTDRHTDTRTYTPYKPVERKVRRRPKAITCRAGPLEPSDDRKYQNVSRSDRSEHFREE